MCVNIGAMPGQGCSGRMASGICGGFAGGFRVDEDSEGFAEGFRIDTKHSLIREEKKLIKKVM